MTSSLLIIVLSRFRHSSISHNDAAYYQSGSFPEEWGTVMKIVHLIYFFSLFIQSCFEEVHIVLSGNVSSSEGYFVPILECSWSYLRPIRMLVPIIPGIQSKIRGHRLHDIADASLRSGHEES